MQRKSSGSQTRYIVLVLMIAFFLAVAILPLVFLQHLKQGNLGDPAYRELLTYSKAHNGDDSYSKKANDLLPTFVRHEGLNGTYTLAKQGKDAKCWVLDVHPGTLGAPRVGIAQDCQP